MRKFGLIGYPLSHSFSQRYFTGKFQTEGITDAVYETYPLPDISGLSALLRDPELCGLNVTIPYKEQVIPFLHLPNEIVGQINACNCIRIQEGRLYGFNTDVFGFQASLIRQLKPSHRQALILGTGGAAKAVEYVLRELGISYRFVTRRPRPLSTDLLYQQVDAAVLRDHTLLINTTPVGMYPDVTACPALPYASIGPQHYLYDLVYNPERTLFLQKGAAMGAAVENGYEMLILQAEESWRIWNA